MDYDIIVKVSYLLTTTNHEKIKSWAEERGGFPVLIGGHDPKIHIYFNNQYSNVENAGNGLYIRKISWNEFFQKFETKKLVFYYQNETASGHLSNYCEFYSQ